MEFQFEVDSFISRLSLVMASQLDGVGFFLDSDSRLNGCPVVRFDQPRALDEDGRIRLDMFGFFVEEADESMFIPGQTVALVAQPSAEEGQPNIE